MLYTRKSVSTLLGDFTQSYLSEEMAGRLCKKPTETWKVFST